MKWIKEIFNRKKTHEHSWNFKYRTGNPNDGCSSIFGCDCGRMSVHHYGAEEKVLIAE